MVSCCKTMRERLLGTSGIISSWDYETLNCIDSHLMGFFYRTIRMVENGIKPAYVFDGKPPELKSGVVCVIAQAHAGHSLTTPNGFSYLSVSNEERKQKKQERRRRKPVSYLCAVKAEVLIRQQALPRIWTSSVGEPSKSPANITRSVASCLG